MKNSSERSVSKQGLPTLEQHVALITGASRGIGRAIAIHLASIGCRLMLTGRDVNALTSTAKACSEFGVRVETYAADVRHKNELAGLVDACMDAFGELDIVIVNQGIAKGGLFSEDTQNAWEDIIDVNLKASMALTQLVLPHLQNAPADKKRALIFISSMAAKFTSPKLAAYHASKYGLLGFSHAIFEEVREFGIKVSVLCPGMVNTNMIKKSSNMDFNKVLQPSDVAEAVSYVIHSSVSVCPVEILLRPQRSPYKVM